MKKTLVVVALVLVVGLVQRALAADYLVRVKLPGPDAFEDLGARGIRVIAGVDQGCLALLADDELDRLGKDYQGEILDVSPWVANYYVLTTRASLDGLSLDQVGTVLYREPQLALLRTTEEPRPLLGGLPVELTKLTLEPELTQVPELPPIEPRPMSDTTIARIVAQVSEDSVLGSIRRMQNFYTRYSTTDSCRAAVNWALSRMRAYNCDSVYGHVYRASYAPNGVGIKYGTVNPRWSYIICGHIDNTSDYQPQHCPGADDNASGATAALEACRVFADYEFDYTVQFIVFSGEEQGLYGSDSFSRQAYRRNDTILGVLNFDMISYGRTGYDGLEIAGQNRNPNCSALVNTYCACADTYALLSYTKRYYNPGSGYGSDHYYFWQRGYRAIWAEERDFTPMYHTIGDTIGPPNYRNCGTNNIPQCTEGIKAAVATLAKLAGARQVTGVTEGARPKYASIGPTLPSLFRNETWLGYALPQGQEAHLRVYDLQGKLVRDFGRVSSGRHLVRWDGRTRCGVLVPAGVYFYRLEGDLVTDFGKAVRVGR